MEDNSQSIPHISPIAQRVVGIILFSGAVFVLVLNMWGWATRGYSWTTLLFPSAVLLLMTSYRIIRSCPGLHLLLQVIAMSLLIASTFFTLRGLGRL